MSQITFYDAMKKIIAIENAIELKSWGGKTSGFTILSKKEFGLLQQFMNESKRLADNGKLCNAAFSLISPILNKFPLLDLIVLKSNGAFNPGNNDNDVYLVNSGDVEGCHYMHFISKSNINIVEYRDGTVQPETVDFLYLQFEDFVALIGSANNQWVRALIRFE